MRVIGVLNRDGGTFKTTDMDAFAAQARETFETHGHSLEVRVVGGGELIAELKRASRDAEVLLAGGGDGTISAAAAIAFESGVPLAALPAGTMNLFARSLKIPPALNSALDALAAGVGQDVDIATANGRPFVHQFSVGIHPKLVRLREAMNYRSRLGKIIASARASLGVMLNPPNFHVEILTPRGLERRRVAGISVSNNPLDEGHLPLADRLDRGVLGIYLLKPLTTMAMLRLIFGLLRGKFSSLPQIVDKQAEEATIRFPRKKSSALAVSDGELLKLPDRIDFRMHKGGLKVIVPSPPAAPESVALNSMAAS